MKQVLITGATSGLGHQLALEYAALGWQVSACGRNQYVLDGLQLQSSHITGLCFDVTNLPAAQDAFDSLETLPSLIILNAGVCEYIEDGAIDTALFRRVFETNLFGLLHCIEAMQARFDSKTHLVLIGSSAAYLPLPRAEAYGASKAAIAYLAHTLAIDLEKTGVTVSLVSPGFVKTPLSDKNDFAMPMLMPVEDAAHAVIKGIERQCKDIHFPKRFTYFLKAIALLPVAWRLPLIKRMTRGAK